MKISIIGNNLTGLILAKALFNKNINVEIFYGSKSKKYKSNRTIAITNKNMNFVEKNLFHISKKFINPINEIGIATENSNNKEIFNFKNKKNLFYLIRNDDFIKVLKKNLKGVKLNKIKNQNFYKSLLNKNKKDLIINCEKNNIYNKKFFHKKFNKNYNSTAFTFIINHEPVNNNKALQIFTKHGPLAFLPLSKFQTSIVFSINKKSFIRSDSEVYDLFKKYNKIYKKIKFSKIEKVELKFEVARHYYHDEILLFGDSLHQIHPLAGQGFNMTIRDLQILINEIIKIKELGLPINKNLLKEFQSKTKTYNFLYSNSINLIESFFKIDNNFKNKISNSIPFSLNKNKIFKNFFMKVADEGFSFF